MAHQYALIVTFRKNLYLLITLASVKLDMNLIRIIYVKIIVATGLCLSYNVMMETISQMMDVVLLVKNRLDLIVIGVKALLHVKAKYY